MRSLFVLLCLCHCALAVEGVLSEADLSLLSNYSAPVLVTQFDDPRVSEVSGLICSQAQADLFWVINDSGNPAAIYGLSAAGKLRAVISLKGIENRDWESLGHYVHNKKRYLVVAECGDNLNLLPVSALYIIEEPILDQIQDQKQDNVQQFNLSPQRIIHYSYADGPRDCEALFVDHHKQEFVLITKRDLPARVYTMPLFVDDDNKVIAKHVANLKQLPQPQQSDLIEDVKYGRFRSQVTGVSINKQATLIAVNTYKNIYVYKRELDHSWSEVFEQKPFLLKRPQLKQAEAISFDAHGHIWFCSEQLPWPLYQAEIKPSN